MKKPIGVSGIQRNLNLAQSFQSFGDNLNRTNKQKLQEQLELLRLKLSKFLKTRQNDLQKDPLLLSQLRQICAEIGLDPLQSAKHSGLNELLSFFQPQDRYVEELAVQLVECCMVFREATGGLVEYEVVRKRLCAARNAMVTEADIVRAVDCLRPLGSFYKILLIDNQKLIQSVPLEFTLNEQVLLSVAGDNETWLDAVYVMGKLKWTEARFQVVIEGLLASGLVWMDVEKKYWFPCLFFK